MLIKIATRKSALAMWQAEHVASRLRTLGEVAAVELLPMSTRGDEVLDRSLQKIGGKGLFIKELEVAMQAGEADIAVHSMKDVPAEMPQGFVVAAMLERANPADALVSSNGRTLDELPHGARIGSSSLRRQAQLRALRQDLEIGALRGNVNTRLARLDAGEFDAIVLAAAGLERLGLADRISEQFEPARMLPAAGQGVIGIECLAERDDLCRVLQQLEHVESRQRTLAERAVARTLAANCQSPLACYAELRSDILTLTALVAAIDGLTILRETQSGGAVEAESLGASVAARLLEQGAGALLEAAE